MPGPNEPWDETDLFSISVPLSPGGEVKIGPQKSGVVTETPVQIYKRLEKETEPPANRAIGQSERGLMTRLQKDVEAAMQQLQPPQRPKPLKPQPVPPAPPSKEAPPPHQDSPAAQGARDVPAPVQILPVPTNGPPNPREPSNKVFDQGRPTPPEMVILRVEPAPVSDAELQAALRRMRRNEPEPGELDPTNADARARSEATDADPVELFTGKFTLASVDLEVPSPFLPIRFRRVYRSGRPYFGPFGFGWDHCYNVYLRPLKQGDLALWTGELCERRLRATGTGWDPEPGLTAALERAPGPADAYELRHPGGLRWRFERPAGWGHPERIPLVAITDRHRNQVKLSYDPDDRLASVLDGEGRGLRFGYGSCGLLERVTDHAGARAVSYHHHPEIEQLVQVVLPPTPGFPGGMTAAYEYDRGADHPAMQHNILRVLDARGRTAVENEYAGPEAGWTFNSVVRQRAGNFEYRFEYEELQYVWPDPIHADVPATRTCVRTPDDALHVYTFNYRGDLLEHRYRLNRDGSYRVIASQWRCDAEGNTIESVGPDGLRCLQTFDSANPDPCARRNLLRIERAAPLPHMPSRIVFRAEYEPRYQLPVRVSGERGAQTRLIYDLDSGVPGATGRLERVELPQVTLDDGTIQRGQVRTGYDPHGQLRWIETGEGARTELQRIATGTHAGFTRRIVEDPAGTAAETSFEYDAAGFVARIVEPGGRAREIRCDALGRIEQVTLPEVAGSTAVLRQWFDDSGGLVRLERPRGGYDDATLNGAPILDELDRDVQGRVMAIRLAANTGRSREARARLDHDGRPVSTWSPGDARTDRRYDERGALLAETRAVGTAEAETTRYDYDRAGRLVRVQHPSGAVVTIDRDVWGRPVRVHRGSTVTRYEWGPEDCLIERRVEGSPGPGEAPRLLARETFECDQRSRLRASTRWSFAGDPGSAVPLTTRYHLDADDRVRAIRTSRGAVATFEYDGLGRVIRTTDPSGQTRIADHDAAGDLRELICEHVEDGIVRRLVRRYEYDGRGRLRAAEAAGGRWEMDLDDRDLPVEVRASGGVVERHRHGPHGELDETLRDPGGLALRSAWERDREGRVARFWDPAGQATRWEHDALGRLRSMTLPDGSSWQTTFNPGGRRIQTLMPSGALITQDLDPFFALPARITSLAAAGQQDVPPHDYAYDGLGRLVRASQPGGTVERRYDGLGRLAEETVGGKTVRFEHDDLTGTRDLVFPDGRRERTFTDAGGRPSRTVLVAPGALGGVAGQVLAEIEYAAGLRPRRIAHGNGVETHFAYDDEHRLTSVEHGLGGARLEASRASYDARQRRAVTQQLAAPARQEFHHFDAADRLTEARWGFGLNEPPLEPSPQAQFAHIAAAEVAAAAAPRAEAFALGPGDERLTLARTGATPALETHVHAPGHRLASVSGEVVVHGPDGTRTADGRQRYDLDGWGRIVRVRDAATGLVRVELAYDALSRWASGTDGDGTFTRWFAGPAWIEEQRAARLRQATPHPLVRLPLCVRDEGATFLHVDGGLSSACATDEGGAVRERYRFDPFGQVSVFAPDGVTPRPAAGAAITPVWRGMPYVAAADCYATAHRLYHPRHGVFLSRDPLLYADSPNPYAFAGQDPIDFADPTGAAKTPHGEPLATRRAGTPDEHSELWKALYKQTGTWWYQPVEGDVFRQTPGIDSGSILKNVAANFWIGLSNFTAWALNAPVHITHGLERGARAVGFSQTEIQGFYDMSAIGLIRIGVLFEGAAALVRQLAAARQEAKQFQAAMNAVSQMQLRILNVYPGVNKDELVEWYMDAFLRPRGWTPAPSQFANKNGLDRVYFNWNRTRALVGEAKYQHDYRLNDIEQVVEALKDTRYGRQGTWDYSYWQVRRILDSEKATPAMKQTARSLFPLLPDHRRIVVLMNEFGEWQIWDWDFWEMYEWGLHE